MEFNNMVSEKKTKIMIFNKSGHLRKMSVRIGDLNSHALNIHTWVLYSRQLVLHSRMPKMS